MVFHKRTNSNIALNLRCLKQLWGFARMDLRLALFQVPLDTEFEGLNSLTPLHAAALEVIEVVKEAALKDNLNNLPEVFDVFFKFARVSLAMQKQASKDGRFREKLSLFGESCIESVANCYSASARADSILVSYSIVCALT